MNGYTLGATVAEGEEVEGRVQTESEDSEAVARN